MSDQPKTATEKADEMGRRHANPILRDMYPSTSRGDMAKQFAQLYLLGHAEGRREALEMAQGLVQALNIALGDITNAFAQRPAWTSEHKTTLIYKTICDGSRALAKFEAWREGK